MSLYEKVLATLADGAEMPKPRPPRASAAVVPWRVDADGGLEVFWVRRAATMPFMGGWHAFPGGGLSRRDRGVEVPGAPLSVDGTPEDGGFPEGLTAGLDEVAPNLLPGLVACAIRELFEETGLLPLAREPGASPDADGLETARKRVLRRELGVLEAARELGLDVDASRLVWAGRWLTPPLGPLRFDNRFFLLEVPASSRLQPAIVPGELDHGEWLTPANALARWRGGEVLAAPPILHLLQVLGEDGPVAGLPRLHRPVEADLGPHRKVEFRPGVLLFPVATPTLPPAATTNSYLLGFGECVLVDPGSPFPEENDRLLAALDAAREKLGRRVTAIWLTHHHPDHVGGVETLRRALGVPVLAHPATAERLRPMGIEVDGTLEEGEVELEGSPAMRLRILHTPGHARGHLCFLDVDRGSLVAGDLVAGFGTIVIDPPEGEMAAYLGSLERTAALRPRTLFPAHGPTLLDAEGKLRETARHRRWREERVAAAWAAGLRDEGEIVERVYEDLQSQARPLAERQVRAHLEHLGVVG